MTKPTYRVGDKVTIVLDTIDADDLNSYDNTFIYSKQIIHHEAAPKPEPIVVWQVFDFDSKSWNVRSADPITSKPVRKLLLNPDGTWTCEDVK